MSPLFGEDRVHLSQVALRGPKLRLVRLIQTLKLVEVEVRAHGRQAEGQLGVMVWPRCLQEVRPGHLRL